MATWTEELKQEVIAKYEGAGPTPESSTEIIKDIAEEIEMSPNGVRMVLVQAGVYVKKKQVLVQQKLKHLAVMAQNVCQKSPALLNSVQLSKQQAKKLMKTF